MTHLHLRHKMTMTLTTHPHLTTPLKTHLKIPLTTPLATLTPPTTKTPPTIHNLPTVHHPSITYNPSTNQILHNLSSFTSIHPFSSIYLRDIPSHLQRIPERNIPSSPLPGLFSDSIPFFFPSPTPSPENSPPSSPENSPPRKFGPEPPPSTSPNPSSLVLALLDDAKRGREILTQPSLWLDEDIAAALRRAMDHQRLGRAESLIRGEAIRFMQQQRSDSQRSKLEMVLYNPPADASPPELEPDPESSSAEPPPSVPALNILEEILMKYGLKRQDHPPIVIAKPIPPSEPFSAPSPPVVSFSKSRKKHVARKGTGTSEPTESEEEESAGHTEPPELERTSQPGEASDPLSAPPYVPPPLVEIKLEVEDMTPEEFERYGNTDRLTFDQFTHLDAERGHAKHPDSLKRKGKGKGKGKGKSSEGDDSSYPVWNVKVRPIHYPFGSMPISDSPFGEFAGLTEVNDLKKAIEESLESERLRRARAEAELQDMLAQIDQSEKDAQLAKMQEECNQKQLERERKKRHQL